MIFFFFFDVFINHFLKIHSSVLHKITDLLYFRNANDVSQFFAEVGLIHAEQLYLYNFIILRKKRDSNTSVFPWNLGKFQEQWRLLLKTRNILLHNKHLRRA